MISSFKSYLIEEDKTVYFTFGRMNPTTIGHEKLMDVLAQKAGSHPYHIYMSQSQDPSKNPLQYNDKVKFARKMFPRHARSIIFNRKLKNVFDVLTKLYNEGFKNINMVVGSDRVTEFKTLINKYDGVKGRHGFYKFNSIQVISAGERDPDSEGVSGMSASKMRDFAKKNNFTSFSQGLPAKASNADAKLIFNAVRKGMGLKEEKSFKRHIELMPVSIEREAYVRGELFNEGDEVIIKDTNELAKIVMLGSNYIIVESNGQKMRKWLKDIEVLEKKNPEDPDIGDRKGSQPVNYHAGLKKSTKIARDRQFKKQAKMADDNPKAYKPAPGDKTAKTKPSKYTKTFKDMYGD